MVSSTPLKLFVRPGCPRPKTPKSAACETSKNRLFGRCFFNKRRCPKTNHLLLFWFPNPKKKAKKNERDLFESKSPKQKMENTWLFPHFTASAPPRVFRRSRPRLSWRKHGSPSGTAFLPFQKIQCSTLKIMTVKPNPLKHRYLQYNV